MTNGKVLQRLEVAQSITLFIHTCKEYKNYKKPLSVYLMLRSAFRPRSAIIPVQSTTDKTACSIWREADCKEVTALVSKAPAGTGETHGDSESG
jgi:hypothetical protein